VENTVEKRLKSG